MKRHKNLFEQVTSFENLLCAAKKTQRGKRFTPAAAAFNHCLEEELLRLQEELSSQSYRPGPYRTFTIHDPKPRLISAAPYRDRVVHHALCNIVEPIFDRVFIHDSYACRPGKGTHAAVDRLTHFQQNNDYALKCDIQKYFASIDHAILKNLLRRKIGCPGALWLMDLIIDHGSRQDDVCDYFMGDDLFSPLERRRGLPIGNQTSQFFANVYLNGFDHFLKERMGCECYIRYVDDFVVLADDKGWLWNIRGAIHEYLQDNLRLRLHARKQTVLPVAGGVDFLGYRVYPEHRRLWRSSGFRFASRLRKMQEQYQQGLIEPAGAQQRIASWIGHARHADTYGLRTALFDGAVFRRGQTHEPACFGAVPGTTTTRTTSAARTATGINLITGTTTTDSGASLVRTPHSL